MVAGIAGKENIGVVEAVSGFDASFHIRDVNPAARTPNMGAKHCRHVESDGVVSISCACLDVDIPINIFVLDETLCFELEVFVRGERYLFG